MVQNDAFRSNLSPLHTTLRTPVKPMAPTTMPAAPTRPPGMDATNDTTSSMAGCPGTTPDSTAARANRRNSVGTEAGPKSDNKSQVDQVPYHGPNNCSWPDNPRKELRNTAWGKTATAALNAARRHPWPAIQITPAVMTGSKIPSGRAMGAAAASSTTAIDPFCC